MNPDNIYTEKLFSYGTLRYESVQLNTFGRLLVGKPDILSGFNLAMLEINNQEVVATSGEALHPIISFSGAETDQVAGFVFDVTAEELAQADSYEVKDYQRIQVQLHSGTQAWVYVNAVNGR